MEVAPLLQAAKALRLNIIGLSFHVGSVTTDGGFVPDLQFNEVATIVKAPMSLD
ncbi:hypothetical protein Patl1_32747 [Pistacia atlantica]|uniref:Uncharacterized protein n=1 Tax=Pistacia atlantica TaxID=434234 RepID=A0ACC1ALZ7_9ROSI|nr:hypothetical protein Patl1_32747 [Pistacia atlantica]